MEKLVFFLRLIKSKDISDNSGLTLVEVLIATLIVIAFIAISLQALTVAALFKSRARVQNDAMSWIQEHLEKVREQATAIAVDPSKCKTTVATGGYAQQLSNSLPVINDTNNTRDISGINYQIVRTPEIRGSQPSGGNCSFNACYEILHLNYQIKGTGGQSDLIFAEINTEVIPDATFKCQI
jgi:Tfp pilus assembly protein PilE